MISIYKVIINLRVFLVYLSVLFTATIAMGKQRLAVLELTGSSGFSVEQLMYLSDQLRAEAQGLVGNTYIIMSREVMSELTDSPALMEACEKNCEVDIGRALQAHWIISGRIIDNKDLYQATLKLHDVTRGVTIEIEFAEGHNFTDVNIALKEANGRLLTHLINTKEEHIASLKLPSARLPKAFTLSTSDTLGLPIPLLKQYDRALIIDEDKQANIEIKIDTWSKLTRYRNYPKLRAEAIKRLNYWRQRFKRRIQCNQTWKQLEQLLSLKRALSAAKKQSLIESFLDACGRNEIDNPHLNAPYFVHKRREKRLRQAESEAKRLRAEKIRLIKAKETKRVKEKLAAARVRKEKLHKELNEKEYSILETHVGASYYLKVGSISSYHLRFRLQPQSWLARQVFIDAETSFTQIESFSEAEATWSGEWGGLLGYQWFNRSDWIPSLSLGYQLRSGEHRALSEIALRYRPIKEWLNIHLSLQYLYLLSADSPQAISRGNLPRVNILDERTDELRLSVWASTGFLGLSLILLSAFILSQQ